MTNYSACNGGSTLKDKSNKQNWFRVNKEPIIVLQSNLSAVVSSYLQSNCSSLNRQHALTKKFNKEKYND